MSNQSRNVKKSAFVAQSTVPDDGTLDFVITGSNKKITYANFLSNLGVTGSIQQEGLVTATPILNTSGTVNNIRNIEDGSGIIASVSGNGGVQLDHNFTVDDAGVEIMSNKTAASPTLRSIVAGSGINVAAQNGSIQIATTATPASTKTVIVNELSDFPAPVSGTITLDADTQYFCTNDISTSNDFVLQDNTVLNGSDGLLLNLTYTGSGTMFTSVNASIKIRDLVITCASGTLLAVSGTGVETFQFQRTTIEECDTVGSITNMALASFDTLIFSDIVTDGITFFGTNSVISMTQTLVNLNGGTFFDLGASTCVGFVVSPALFNLASGTTFLAGLSASGNIVAGGLGTVINTRFLGLGTPLSVISETDNLWQFLLNDGVPDSRDVALMSNSGDTYTISVIDTPVKIDTNWTEEEASRFDTDATGTMTYKGKGATLALNAVISAEMVSVGTRNCTFYFFKNGVEITNSGIQRALQYNNPGSISLVWDVELETDDYIELYVENNENTVNVVVNRAIVRIG